MSMDKSAIEAIQAAQQVAEVTQALDAFGEELAHPLIAMPSDVSTESLERYLPGRVRARGLLRTEDIGAFVDYTLAKNKHQPAVTFVSTDELTAKSVFNLGTDEKPGHGDDTAFLELPPTAEMRFLLKIANSQGAKYSQQDFAELVEEWRDNIRPFHDFDAVTSGAQSSIGQALASIRKVDVKATRDQSSSEGEYRRDRSDLESVEIQSAHLPGFLCFTCVPYTGLAEKEFWIRVTTYLDGNAPRFGLRVIRLDVANQEMREELHDILDTRLRIMVEERVTMYRGHYKTL